VVVVVRLDDHEDLSRWNFTGGQRAAGGSLCEGDGGPESGQSSNAK
jgi:hypothetical protein